MWAVGVLQCIVLVLALHVTLACQSGEVVKARWTDGTWMHATIVEVRERDDGICGQIRIVWHHNDICEDPTIYGDDTRVSMTFCLVSRDSIRGCKQELCTQDHAESDFGTGADEESKNYVGVIIAVVSLSLACCCCILCVQKCCGPHDNDEEKGRDPVTPASVRSFWNFTPKSATSFQMAKWKSKSQRVAGPSINDKKIRVQPEPVAAALPDKHRNGKLDIAEQKHVQPKKGAGRHDLLCPPGMLQTHGSALRHAAQTYGGPAVPPRSICPPPQLPTLLQQRGGLNKSLPRKKPPLQGVPPQGTMPERVKQGPFEV